MNKITIQAMLLASAFLSHAALADTATCIGKVNKLSNQVPNGFYMSLADSGNMKVCNPEQDSFLVTPQNCKHIASLSALAYATNKDLTVVVENSPGPNCSDIPDNHDADISYTGIDPQ